MDAFMNLINNDKKEDKDKEKEKRHNPEFDYEHQPLTNDNNNVAKPKGLSSYLFSIN